MLKPPFTEMVKDDTGRVESHAETRRREKESAATLRKRGVLRGVSSVTASALRRTADRLDPVPSPRRFPSRA